MPWTSEDESRAGRCALLVVDLERGDVVHWLRFDGAIQELYDVAVLPGARRPMAIGLRSDEIRRVITIGDAATLPASGPTRPSPRGA